MINKKLKNNKTLCTCFKCKKKGNKNIGKYVHYITKWRHINKAKRRKYNFDLNELLSDDNEDDDIEEEDDNEEDDDNEEEDDDTEEDDDYTEENDDDTEENDDDTED